MGVALNIIFSWSIIVFKGDSLYSAFCSVSIIVLYFCVKMLVLHENKYSSFGKQKKILFSCLVEFLGRAIKIRFM